MTVGDGYGHLAVSVADPDATHARHTVAGLAPRKTMDFRTGDWAAARGRSIADPDGHQIEVPQRGGRFR